MNIKSTKAALGLLLILGLMQFPQSDAAGNSLTQLDIRKTQADSSVEVTLYTTNPYGENVAVTKKSDNKYVILMPNLSDGVSRKPDLSNLGDMISDVDVKAVNDGGHGYTKVTLTTSKPLNIKTKLEKSMPVTAEQKAYRELIEKSRMQTFTPTYVHDTPQAKTQQTKSAVKNDKPADKTKTAEVKKQSENLQKQAEKQLADKKQKDEKLAAAQKEISVTNKQKIVEDEVKKNVGEKPQTSSTPISTPVEVSAVPAPIETVQAEPAPISDLDNSKKHGNPFNFLMLLVPIAGLFFLIKLIRNSVTASQELRKSFINNLADKPSEPANYENIIQDDNIGWQKKYQQYVSVASVNDENSFAQKAIVAADTNNFSYVSAAADNISDTISRIKRPSRKLESVNNTHTENIVQMKPQTSAMPVEIVEPIEIVEPPAVNTAPRSRKEKIAKNTNTKEIKKTKKVSVKKVVDAEVNKAVQALEQRINKLEAEKEMQEKQMLEAKAAQNDFEKHALKKKQEMKIMENKQPHEEEYLVSLEQLLMNSPDAEKTNLNEDMVLKELEQNFKDITVHREEDAIAANMINSISSISKIKKLKAFEENIALEETSRTKPAPKRRSDVVSSVSEESRHVNLGYSKLHSTSRILDGGNLSVGDLMAKSGKLLNKPMNDSQVKPKLEKPAAHVSSNDYSMATLDEFFALEEPASKATAPEFLSNRVAASLAQIKPSMKIQKPVPASSNMSNPIASANSDKKESALNGLIVKSGYNIDKNKGFYIVNLDGETALVGRIKEEIFVLKKFASNIEKPLQVRKDNPNVYMVKADGFRSLVEVGEDKMGVLIEL